ncbi:DNA gyrase C-terminal beta-propeller domain-containing protein, partial [Mycoplasmopsis bovis]|uniref:DNA gyrase C-terminal beta-propeller domain-containing protein n=1 Tax=Mycoplasmopsis bovis TaxID=28903 RepID=UPI003D2B6327
VIPFTPVAILLSALNSFEWNLTILCLSFATGVKGITLADDETCISASSSSEGELILTIGRNGFGKITHHSLFRLVHRGGKGVIGINSDKAGNLVFARFVNPHDEILMITT